MLLKKARLIAEVEFLQASLLPRVKMGGIGDRIEQVAPGRKSCADPDTGAEEDDQAPSAGVGPQAVGGPHKSRGKDAPGDTRAGLLHTPAERLCGRKLPIVINHKRDVHRRPREDSHQLLNHRLEGIALRLAPSTVTHSYRRERQEVSCSLVRGGARQFLFRTRQEFPHAPAQTLE